MFGVQEDRKDAMSHLNAIVDSTRGNPVLVSSMLLSSMHDLLKYFWDLDSSSIILHNSAFSVYPSLFRTHFPLYLHLVD